MPILNCYVDDDTMLSLRRASFHTGRSVENLAEAAIAEAALQSLRGTVASIQGELHEAIDANADIENAEQPSMGDCLGPNH